MRTFVRMTRPPAEVQRALELAAAGLNDRQVADRLGLPRSTVRDWRRRRQSPKRRHPQEVALPLASEPELTRSYLYLLGLYLGDGCISCGPRTERIRFTLDSRYPTIIVECVAALRIVVPGRRVWWGKRPASACVDVSLYYGGWSVLIPQHGPGKKHHRHIELADWQDSLLATAHEPFLRGLIHSDGCRTVATDRGRRSVRYHFSNRSEDIKALYCASLDALGIRWTRPSSRDIAVYRQEDVARLDAFVGPKG
jgi:Homeodomain-like domain-containing protein